MVFGLFPNVLFTLVLVIVVVVVCVVLGFALGDVVFVFAWVGGLPGSACVGFCGGFGFDL